MELREMGLEWSRPVVVAVRCWINDLSSLTLCAYKMGISCMCVRGPIERIK